MSTPTPQVSIVVPLFNEKGNVEPLCQALIESLRGWDHSWEALLVDDGSTDGTTEHLRLAMERDHRLRVLTLAVNQGQTAALAVGFSRARGGILVSLDGDLQCHPSDIPAVVEQLEQGFDLVTGWRKQRQDAWMVRVLPSRMANSLLARLTGVKIHDSGCPLKAYRAELVRTFSLYSDLHRFLPVLSSMSGARIGECVVQHRPRVHGRSKYGLSRTFKVIADLVSLKMLVHFYNRPGSGLSLLALPWIGLGLLSLGAWWFTRRWNLDPSVVFPSLAVMFFYLAGHLLGLAFFAEIYMARADVRDSQELVVARAIEPPARDGMGA